jgi:predicted nucleic acid-binding protein
VAALLVDTDVFIDHLRGARPFRRGGNDVHYSVVTLAELFAGDGTEEPVIARLLRPCRPVPVGPAIAMRAGRLVRRYRIESPDALIAATAVEHDLPLVTRNLRHFAQIKGLQVRRPR